MLDSHSKYTDSFLLWCRKTEHLTDEQWAYGFNQLELLVSKNMAAGEDNWPPSYAEFIVMAKKTISPDGHNSNAYLDFNDERNSSYQPKRLESDEQKTATQSAHDKAMEEMKW